MEIIIDKNFRIISEELNWIVQRRRKSSYIDKIQKEMLKALKPNKIEVKQSLKKHWKARDRRCIKRNAFSLYIIIHNRSKRLCGLNPGI